MILQLDLHDEKITPLNVASALIDFAIETCDPCTNKDINFIIELSQHLDVASRMCIKNREYREGANERVLLQSV